MRSNGLILPRSWVRRGALARALFLSLALPLASLSAAFELHSSDIAEGATLTKAQVFSGFVKGWRTPVRASLCRRSGLA